MTRPSSLLLSSSAHKFLRFSSLKNFVSLALFLSCGVGSLSSSVETAVPKVDEMDDTIDSTIPIEITSKGDTITVSATEAEEGAYHLEESRNLSDWIYLRTFYGNPNGYFYDAQLTQFDRLFYRIKSPSVAGFSQVTAGNFVMGSPDSEEGRNSNETQHMVTLTRDYYLQRTEVTNEQMAAVLNWALSENLLLANPSGVSNRTGNLQELVDLDDSHCHISYSANNGFEVDTGKELYPCMEVSWYGAMAYCYYLSQMEGLEQSVDLTDWSLDLDATGYRLPTEAEWEYSCRAGTQTAYYTGNREADLATAGWYLTNSSNPSNRLVMGKGTDTVGVKIANSWELNDMHGNVWEWCWDWLGSYDGDATDPTGAIDGSMSTRVIRGGGWHENALQSRSANRAGHLPSSTFLNIGFRVARSINL